MANRLAWSSMILITLRDVAQMASLTLPIATWESGISSKASVKTALAQPEGLKMPTP